MILAMIVAYCFLLYLLFDVFKVVQSTTRNRIYVTLIGIFLIICVLFVINYYQPMSTNLRVYRYVIPISSRVAGPVIDVPVQSDTPIKKGDVLFKIDPRPYQAEVDRLSAALAEAEQKAQMLPVELKAAQAAVASAKARVIDARQQADSLGAKLRGARATVEKLEAERALAQTIYERDLDIRRQNVGAISEQQIEIQLRNLKAAEAALKEANALAEQAQMAADAKIDGVNTVVVTAEQSLLAAIADESEARLALESTIDGENTTVAQTRAALALAKTNLEYCTVRAPASGFTTEVTVRPGQILNASSSPVMSFISEDEYVLAASFHQVVLGNIRSGDESEICLDDWPGYTFTGKVKTINWGNPKGQVLPSGQIVDPKPIPHGRFFVEFTLDDDHALVLPAGEAGAATIYTQYGRPWVPVRKVFFRWYTWINFIITEMDIRGERE